MSRPKRQKRRGDFWKLAAATAVIQGTGFIMKLNSGVLLEAKPWA